MIDGGEVRRALNRAYTASNSTRCFSEKTEEINLFHSMSRASRLREISAIFMFWYNSNSRFKLDRTRTNALSGRAGLALRRLSSFVYTLLRSTKSDVKQLCACSSSAVSTVIMEFMRIQPLRGIRLTGVLIGSYLWCAWSWDV